jgi:dihydroflavonol-4-reductase
MKTAAIIGGSGYIGSYVTQKFLREGFRVKVSATDISKKKKYQHLRQLEHAENLEIIQADITDIRSLRALTEGCDVAVHGGTPFQLDVKDPEKELLEPTIQGTGNFLKAVQESPSLKKAVIIASVGSFNTSYPMPAESFAADHLYTETNEPHLNKDGHPYSLSKYYADQAVQQFLRDHPDCSAEIVSVYPVTVMGPALSNREDSTSAGLQYLFKNRIAPNPFVQMLFDNDVEFAVVDVRDVAEVIYKAATISGLHGKQYYLSNESWKVSDITRMLNNERVQDKARFVYSGKRAEKELSFTFRPAAETFRAYAEKPAFK